MLDRTTNASPQVAGNNVLLSTGVFLRGKGAESVAHRCGLVRLRTHRGSHFDGVPAASLPNLPFSKSRAEWRTTYGDSFVSRGDSEARAIELKAHGPLHRGQREAMSMRLLREQGTWHPKKLSDVTVEGTNYAQFGGWANHASNYETATKLRQRFPHLLPSCGSLSASGASLQATSKSAASLGARNRPKCLARCSSVPSVRSSR